MKRLLLMMSLYMGCVAAMAGNPILKNSDPDFLYLADPSAEVYKGKVYVYCSHDQPTAKGYASMQDYVVVSSSDLKTWTNHGVVLKPRTGAGFEYATGQMNAPDAAFKDGWYYYYFPFNKQFIGVAKSRKPEGPWETAVNGAITKIFDPTVFIDDDGQAYIYGNNTSAMPEVNDGGEGKYVMGAKLKDNMIELDGPWMRLSEEPINEAVHVFKRDGKYYFNGRKGARTGYWMADSPLPTKDKGYAEFKGYITPNQKDAPAHNSFIEFKGQWYIFYHRGDVNDGYYFRRSACFDKVFFNEDGTIQPIVYTLDEGVETNLPRRKLQPQQ